MTNRYSKLVKDGGTIYCQGLYVVDNSDSVRSNGKFCLDYPYNSANQCELIDITCWKIEDERRLRYQIGFYKVMKDDRVCHIRFMNLEEKHILHDPRILLTVKEWFDKMNKIYVANHGEKDDSLEEWWDLIGVEMKRISRFLVECLIEMFKNGITHGDLRNGIAFLNNDATQLKLFNCKAKSKFDYKVDRDEVVGLLAALGSRKDPTNLCPLSELEGKKGLPPWFYDFLHNMAEFETTRGIEFLGLEIDFLHCELWTSREKLRFLQTFHDHHFKDGNDKEGATVLDGSTHLNGQAFKWKKNFYTSEFQYICPKNTKTKVLKYRCDEDLHGNLYKETYEQCFRFWRNMMQHYKETTIGKTDFKYQLELMEHLERFFSFCETAYKCLRLGFHEKRHRILTSPITKAAKKKALTDEAEMYVSRFNVLDARDELGYSNLK